MNLEHRKYLRPNEVEEIYGIKVGTLAKQRNHGFGLPYVIIGRKPKKRKGSTKKADIVASSSARIHAKPSQINLAQIMAIFKSEHTNPLESLFSKTLFQFTYSSNFSRFKNSFKRFSSLSF